jgi:hypothetical protein
MNLSGRESYHFIDGCDVFLEMGASQNGIEENGKGTRGASAFSGISIPAN